VVDCSADCVWRRIASLRDMVKKTDRQSPKVVMNMHEVNQLTAAAWNAGVALHTAQPSAR